MSWDASFDEPIALPSGKVLTTLRDAGEYVAGLPKATHSLDRWQTAMGVLIATAAGGPVMMAGIAMRRAINPPGEPVYDPKRKTVWRKAASRSG